MTTLVSAKYYVADGFLGNKPDREFTVWFEAPPRSIFLEQPRRIGDMRRVVTEDGVRISFQLEQNVAAFVSEHGLACRLVSVPSKTSGWEGEPGYFLVFEDDRDLLFFHLRWSERCGAATR